MILTCPKCRETYDPGVDDDLRELPDNASLKVVCPKCGQWVRLPENEPIDPPGVSDTISDAMKAQSRPVEVSEQSSDRPWGEDDDDDRPRRRRRRDEFEEGDREREFDRHGRWSDQAAEDYTDAPGGSKPLDGLGLASMIVGIVSCGIMLTGCCCALFDFVSLAGGITAVIMGFMARRRPTASGMAIAGLITGFIAIAGSLVIIAFGVISFLMRM